MVKYAARGDRSIVEETRPVAVIGSRILTWLNYVMLTGGAVVMLFPFVWMIATSLKYTEDTFTLQLIPSRVTWQHYVDLFGSTAFGNWALNSFIVAAITTVSVSFFGTLVGYILAKFTFAGKAFIFTVILSTLMIPTEMLIIPWYFMSAQLGWVDSYWGVLFPGVISAFGIFMMKQFMDSVPQDLLDAARIDGMGEWGIFQRVVLPLVRPAIATLCILTFLGNWNSFIWPLIIIQSPELLTIPVGLAFLSSELKDSSSWVLIMTGAAVSVLPLIAVFLVFQKQIVRGIAMTGMK
ncbi:carbohydrate ABC transporter permease [Paenibacillus sp. 481]|uniref:carbohydrate ABC transporter permease n=1 Tax=Paenibacillus sp. 481 TaxID=2835869 RepID=UPI001E3D57E3|nr:carbohydrate ABC transporter permease [Paenibacillus sp. 481]UHA74237.1 carbohydrate ABC transporter permease [Paenibacillus sp. 481]